MKEPKVSPSPSSALSERVIFPISKAMLERIEDFRYRRRIPSRADAIRRLIELSLGLDEQLAGNIKGDVTIRGRDISSKE